MPSHQNENRKKRMSESYRPATQPTLYFIGVSTAKSSIMTIFPRWAEYLGIPEAQILGIDFPIHAEPASYRRAVEFIKTDPLSQGALVTTHKIDLFSACRDLFDEIDRHALLMGETSCISKREGKILCHAKDPISSGLTLDGFLPPDHWKNSGAEVFIMGAGGAAIAITWHLMRGETQEEANRPSRILISDPHPSRLAEIRHIHAKFHSKVPVEYIQVSDPLDNDSVANRLKTGSLVSQRDRTRQRRAGLAVDRLSAIPGKRNRLGAELSGRFSLRSAGQRSKGGMQSSDRRWLDLFYPWVDTCDRRGVSFGYSGFRRNIQSIC